MSSSNTKKPAKKPHYAGHRARLRERFLKAVSKNNADILPDYELLELLLFAASARGDVKPIAKQLLAEFGDLNSIIHATPELLRSKGGLSESAIAALKAAQIVAQRSLAGTATEKTVLQGWRSVLEYCQAAMSHEQKEQFRVLFLDSSNRIIKDEILQQGTVNHTPVYPREVLEKVLQYNAVSVILAHNHPSGNVSPSGADVEMTNNIVAALEPINVTVHDHIIIAGNEHFSFAGNGLL